MLCQSVQRKISRLILNALRDKDEVSEVGWSGGGPLFLPLPSKTDSLPCEPFSISPNLWSITSWRQTLMSIMMNPHLLVVFSHKYDIRKFFIHHHCALFQIIWIKEFQVKLYFCNVNNIIVAIQIIDLSLFVLHILTKMKVILKSAIHMCFAVLLMRTGGTHNQEISNSKKLHDVCVSVHI